MRFWFGSRKRKAGIDSRNSTRGRTMKAGQAVKSGKAVKAGKAVKGRDGRPHPKPHSAPPEHDPIRDWETPEQRFLAGNGDPFLDG
jgi:hypothetical protein